MPGVTHWAFSFKDKANCPHTPGHVSIQTHCRHESPLSNFCARKNTFLGLTPDSRVKVLICVEGPTDVPAFRYLSSALHQEDPTIPNLDTDERIAFVVLGGRTLKHWVSEHYLKGLGCPEVHIYDSDVNTYGEAIDAINQRADGKGSWGALTTKHEIENYLHPSAIQAAFGVTIPIEDQPGADGKSVPKLFGEAFSQARGHGAPLGENKAKAKLADQAFPKMTACCFAPKTDPLNPHICVEN